jgi:hypothetical protein
VWGAFVGVVVENVGYRQFTAWWRLRGMWDALSRAPQVWGSMARSGFGPEQIPEGGKRT